MAAPLRSARVAAIRVVDESGGFSVGQLA